MEELKWEEGWWADWLQGPDAEALMHEAGHKAIELFEAMAPEDSGLLVASAAVDVDITKPYQGKAKPRYTATLRVVAPYAAAFEFGYTAKNGKQIPGNHLLRQVLQALSI
ncbi:hypothetical protein CKALI_11290 [Corynebacterium kalinowskii]|uniref:Uncharacterized protein n=1 Tax=Corynebacterium kalinowskii TaxID=2675216 RepID=A0A6B8VD27_9CORY|nr:hypothetical protein [Corynebacterium kalinowskii]QGU03102.1 hypothetical protein CKALI_11290 [Corynebacterium kalinowskii]